MGFVADGSLGRVVGEYREKKDQVNSWGYDYQRICFFRKTFCITTFLCVKGKAREMHWKILGEPSMLKIMSLKKISRISKRLRCAHLWRGRWVTPHGVRHSMIGVWCFHLRWRLYEKYVWFLSLTLVLRSLSSWSISLPSTSKKLHSISPTAPCLSNSLASTSVMKQSTKVGASRSIPAMETNAASDASGAGWTKIQFEEGHQPFSPLNVRPVPEARWFFPS